jgi:hypothetical protein
MPTFDDPDRPAPQPEAGGASPNAGEPAVPNQQISNAEPVTTGEPVASSTWAASGGTTPPSVPPPLLPTPSAAIPPPSMAVAGVDPSGVQPPSTEPPKKKSPLGRAGALLAIGGAALGVIFVKFVLPLILVGAAGQFFDSAFGGPYARLPGDVRSGFEKRIDAAVGNTLDGQTDAAKTDRILTSVENGLSRLDDGLIDTNFRLTTKAIGAVDVKSCAAVARAIVAGNEPPDDAANAMINTLSDSELQQWFEIRVSAVEADMRNSPAQVVVDDAAVNPLYDKLFAIMRSEDIDVIGQLANGTTVEDEPLCTAIRNLYAAVLGLSPQDALLFARYDVSP